MPATGSNLTIDGGPSLNLSYQHAEDIPSVFTLSRSLRSFFDQPESLQPKSLQTAVLDPTKAVLRHVFTLIKQARDFGSVDQGEDDGSLMELLMEVSSTWILLGLLLDPDLSPVVNHKDSEGLNQMDYCEAVQYLIKETPDLDHYSRVLCWLQLELRKQLYLEELQRDRSSVMTVKHPALTRTSLDSLERTNGGQFRNYDLEELFSHCGKYALAGFRSSSANLFFAAGRGHLASPLFTNATPQFNLLPQEGKDFYFQCLPPIQGLASNQMMLGSNHLENGVLNVRKIANILTSNEELEDQFGVHCGSKCDSHSGFGTQSATLNWSSSIKAKTAGKQGFRHEYEFYTLMCGRKHSNECLFTRNWHSQIYAHFHFYLRQEIDRELEKHTKPNEDLMDLEVALTSPSNCQAYHQGREIQSGNGWSRTQNEDLSHHEQALMHALSLHRPQGLIQDFFRTLQSALILKQQSQLLFEFGPRLRELITSLTRDLDSPENSNTQIWLISVLDMLILLINTSHLQKAEMSVVQLLVLDELVNCVLEVLFAQEFVDLIPMYACHLKVTKQVEWYQRIMRSDILQDSKANDWFTEARYWLQQWPGFENESFHRTDDVDSYEISMTEVVYWNAMEICKDLTKGVNERELALWWLGIALEEDQEDTKIQHLARDLYFSLFLEISFLHLPSALEMHGYMPTTFITPDESQEVDEFVSFDHVTRKDLRNWLSYCMTKVDTSMFLNIAERCGFDFEGMKVINRDHFLERLHSNKTQSPHQYFQTGQRTYKKLIQIITSDFFYEPLMFDPFTEKHKIEFVVCKGINERKSFIPFDPESIVTITASIETFLNDILACHEHNAAASSFDTPLLGFITIRMEFKKEALVWSNMLNVLTTFLKGQYKEAMGISIAQFSAPLTLMRRIANTQTKTSMIEDLMKIQRVLRLFEGLQEGQSGVLDSQSPCTLLMDQRPQLLGEERILNQQESLEFLKSEVHLKISEFIHRQF